MNPAHIEWSRGVFNALHDGGVWAVPRSGLIFTKRGRMFVLTSRMPWAPVMPMPRDELETMQKADFEMISLHMLAAGVPVSDSTGLCPAS